MEKIKTMYKKGKRPIRPKKKKINANSKDLLWLAQGSSNGSFKALPRMSRGLVKGYLLGGILITSLMGGGLYAAYNHVFDKGFEEGQEAANMRFRAATEKLDTELRALEKERQREFEDAMEKSYAEALKYQKELQEAAKINASLKAVLSKPPEVIVKYRECVYAVEDHNHTLDLYKELAKGPSLGLTQEVPKGSSPGES